LFIESSTRLQNSVIIVLYCFRLDKKEYKKDEYGVHMKHSMIYKMLAYILFCVKVIARPNILPATLS